MTRLWSFIFVLGLVDVVFAYEASLATTNATTSGGSGGSSGSVSVSPAPPPEHAGMTTGELTLIVSVVGTIVAGLAILAGCVLCRRYEAKRDGYRELPDFASSPEARQAVVPVTNEEITIKYGVHKRLWVTFNSAEVGYVPFNQLRILATLSAGTHGIVYHVRPPGSETDMVLRLIADVDSAQKTEEFLEEIKVLRTLSHKHTLAYFGISMKEQLVGVLMQYMPGGDLETAARRLSEEQMIRALAQAGKGLAYLHLANIVHLDVRPSNIMLDAKDNAVLGGFGLSGVLQSQGQSELYAAPEVVRGDSQITSAADSFSYACCVIRVLTGQAPYSHRTEPRSGDPSDGAPYEPLPPPANIRALALPALVTLLQQSMRNAPDDRPAVTALVTLLGQLV